MAVACYLTLSDTPTLTVQAVVAPRGTPLVLGADLLPAAVEESFVF